MRKDIGASRCQCRANDLNLLWNVLQERLTNRGRRRMMVSGARRVEGPARVQGEPMTLSNDTSSLAFLYREVPSSHGSRVIFSGESRCTCADRRWCCRGCRGARSLSLDAGAEVGHAASWPHVLASVERRRGPARRHHRAPALHRRRFLGDGELQSHGWRVHTRARAPGGRRHAPNGDGLRCGAARSGRLAAEVF